MRAASVRSLRFKAEDHVRSGACTTVRSSVAPQTTNALQTYVPSIHALYTCLCMHPIDDELT